MSTTTHTLYIKAEGQEARPATKEEIADYLGRDKAATTPDSAEGGEKLLPCPFPGDAARLAEMFEGGWVPLLKEDADAVVACLRQRALPVPMMLFCPRCNEQHIDAPEPGAGWTNPPHATHTCKHCGLNWRPSNANSVGVAEIECLEPKHRERIDACRALHQAAQPAEGPFQQRVAPWMQRCFGPVISADTHERNHRFFEEAGELVQACGMTVSEAHQLVDYTWGRPVGEKSQEVGGSMVTLAALCLAQGIDMHACGEKELARILQPEIIEKIRNKQAAKPKHSPLPEKPTAGAAETPRTDGCMSLADAMMIVESYGPLGNDVNEEFQIKILLRDEVLRSRTRYQMAAKGRSISGRRTKRFASTAKPYRQNSPPPPPASNSWRKRWTRLISELLPF